MLRGLEWVRVGVEESVEYEEREMRGRPCGFVRCRKVVCGKKMLLRRGELWRRELRRVRVRDVDVLIFTGADRSLTSRQLSAAAGEEGRYIYTRSYSTNEAVVRREREM